MGDRSRWPTVERNGQRVRGGRIGNERPWQVFGPWIDGKDVRTFGYQEAALGAALDLAQSLPIGSTVWLRHRGQPWVTLHRRPAHRVEANLHWIARPAIEPTPSPVPESQQEASDAD